MRDETQWLRDVRHRLKVGVYVACDWCGDFFVAHDHKTRYCSQTCRNAASKARRQPAQDVRESRR